MLKNTIIATIISLAAINYGNTQEATIFPDGEYIKKIDDFHTRTVEAFEEPGKYLVLSSTICSEAYKHSSQDIIRAVRFFIFDLSEGKVDISEEMKKDDKINEIAGAWLEANQLPGRTACNDILTRYIMNFEKISKIYKKALEENRQLSIGSAWGKLWHESRFPDAPVLPRDFY